MLGVINKYVEHHLCRVVVIAHDEKLVHEIQEAKEKIFGQTIMVEPDVQSAFTAFLDDIINLDVRRFVELHRSVILLIFACSQARSLRILRQTMLDIARLFELLEQRYVQNEHAMTELISLFAALDFEVRMGHLSKADLDRRYMKVVEGAVVENTEAFKAGAARYAEVNLASTLLSNKFLIHSLIQGRYTPTEFQESLDESPHFRKPEDVPAWRRVLEFDTMDDASVEVAFAELEREFLDRSITDFGSMLHTFALRMMMAKHGMLTNSIAEIRDQCQGYIDDLLTADRLLPDFDDYDDRSLGRAAYGFGYWVEETFCDAFNGVIDHLRKRSNEALEKTFSSSSEQLLTILSEDGRAFACLVSFSGDGDHRFARVPVLKALDPVVFVDAWLDASRANNSWLAIRRGLETRYEGLALADGATGQSGWLVPERDWIKEVISLMKRRAESSTGFVRYRIERAIPNVHFPTGG